MAQPPVDPPRKIVVRRTVPPEARSGSGGDGALQTQQGPGPGAPDRTSPHPSTATPMVFRKDVERPHPLTGIARSWIALFGLILVFGRDVAERGLSSIAEMGFFMWIVLGVVLAVVLFNLIWGLVEWRTTTFIADDDEFRIERDFLSRDSSRIAYTKIQSVDIERSLPARLLGLSSVTIDVGGAGGKKLEFLAKERAEILRDQLLARMQRQADAPVSPHGEPVALEPIPGPPPRHTIVMMKAGTLLTGVFISSFLPWLVAGLVALVVMLSFGEGFTIASLGIGVFAFGGYLWTQIANNWKFHLDKVPDGLHMTRGLFTTTSQSLKADRIQAVSIHQDYLQRLTGLYRMRVTVLGLGGGENDQTSGTVLPYGTIEDVRLVLAAFWPGIDLDAIQLHNQPDRARWLTPLGFRRHQWGVDAETVVAHHGWLDHTISLVPHRRMQSIAISQGPLQRRLNLAQVALHTTDGPVTLRLYHLDALEARQFFDEQHERAQIARNTPGAPGYLSALPAPAVEGFVPSL